MTSSDATFASASYASPLGPLTLVAAETGLRAVLWAGDDPERAGLFGAALLPAAHPSLAEAARQLDEYFAGTRTAFSLQFDLEGTPFQQATWRALAEIPYGVTRTYAQQALRLGRPRAFRAIGAANGRNPLSIVLPCHRVIGADGSLTGFAAGLETKRALLEHEQRVIAGRGGPPG